VCSGCCNEATKALKKKLFKRESPRIAPSAICSAPGFPQFKRQFALDFGQIPAQVARTEAVIHKLLLKGLPEPAAHERRLLLKAVTSRLQALDRFIHSTALHMHADPVDLFLALTRFGDAGYSRRGVWKDVMRVVGANQKCYETHFALEKAPRGWPRAGARVSILSCGSGEAVMLLTGEAGETTVRELICKAGGSAQLIDCNDPATPWAPSLLPNGLGDTVILFDSRSELLAAAPQALQGALVCRAVSGKTEYGHVSTVGESVSGCVYTSGLQLSVPTVELAQHVVTVQELVEVHKFAAVVGN
jgi:hypothetical protein